MAKYKVTKVYIVEAATKNEALKLAGSEHLEYISIQEVAEPKKNGWTSEAKRQLTGSK